MIIVKRVDNSTVLLTSNYFGVEPIKQIERWCKAASERKNVPCPQIVAVYNKCMGGVDLADMLISFYGIEVKTMQWYVKIFWHLVHTAKVYAWLLYRRHYQQAEHPAKNEKSLFTFTTDIADTLMHAKKYHKVLLRASLPKDLPLTVKLSIQVERKQLFQPL